MPRYQLLAHYALCMTGILVSLYSLHVESMLILTPGYEPSCDISAWEMSCSKVFKSSHSRILSHWNIVDQNSLLDASLPQIALIYFVFLFIEPVLVERYAFFAQVYRVLTHCGVAFNLYLAYVLKFVIGEFCVVCVTNYFLNAGLFLTASYINNDADRLRKVRTAARKSS